MKIIGVIIILFGLVDLVGSYIGFDLWGGFLGIQLPEVIWNYTSIAELIIGYLLYNLGTKKPVEVA
jgi:hypothetical protein